MVIPILLSALIATTSIPVGQPFVQFLSPEAVLEIPVSKDVIQNVLVPFYANVYGVPQQEMEDIIKCESNFNSSAIGDNGTSIGLAQLHNPLSKGISIPEAYNASFSLNYMANALKNHTDHWSCQVLTGWR